MIPLYIIEEHNEAFRVWNVAVDGGFLPPFGNSLLHVDHHPDFEAGGYGGDMDALFSAPEDILAFGEKCLGIADFICPAIYQGTFNEIVFLRDFMSPISKPDRMTMSLDQSGALSFQSQNALSRVTMRSPEADHRLFTYRQGGLAGEFHTPQPLTLDIDLDYFCWDDSRSGMADKKLEITEEAYRAVTENPYHSFRTLPKMLFRAVSENGRFYIEYFGLPKPDPLPPDELIFQRVDKFARWLEKNPPPPRVISICRSRHSGYTPASAWSTIENELLGKLSELYDYDTQD
jgi:hypothetical protein